MFTIEDLRNYCMAKAHVSESLPFDNETLVFKANGKMFCLASLDANPLSFNVKCSPEIAEELREQYDAVQPGYHMNKKHWNTITVGGELSTKQLKEFIDWSYDLVYKPTKKK